VTGVKKACELTGKSRATVYRRRNGTRSGCRERRPAPANALSAGEREELLAVLDSPRFAGKAPRQVWALLIDEGIYLASVSTMYRGRSASAGLTAPSAAAHDQSRERAAASVSATLQRTASAGRTYFAGWLPPPYPRGTGGSRAASAAGG
jgi:hypothetical protein